MMLLVTTLSVALLRPVWRSDLGLSDGLDSGLSIEAGRSDVEYWHFRGEKRASRHGAQAAF